MDRASSIMIRTSLLWLLAGFVIGGAMLLDESIPGEWRRWMQPGHVHMLVVGWFLQFALGVAIWLFPRKRSPERPLGYNEGLALAATALLNLGLVLRIVPEALQRAGHALTITTPTYVLSATTQILAVALFAWGLWPRVAARPRRSSAPTSQGDNHV
jgi:hypothetical protein